LSGCFETFAARLASSTLETAIKSRRELPSLWRAADGRYDGMDQAEYVAARQAIEDIIGLDEYYGIEESTVESRRPA